MVTQRQATGSLKAKTQKPFLFFFRYEIKNSQFHYEARKNNELLRSGPGVESVCKYRQELAASSKEFQQCPGAAYPETH